MRILLIITFFAQLAVSAKPLQYAPAPVDNPLKGLVPYASQWKKERFPHSMEFSYLSMKAVMLGRGQFDWEPLEKILEAGKSRGKQSIFRIYLEYPGKETGVPDFLLKAGVELTHWKDGGKEIATPDYQNPALRSAIAELIAAMGAKYDGDSRIGFITAGILGLWGEWHNHPRNDLWAEKEIQKEVMRAYEKAFPKTHILLRYPAGEKHSAYADNRASKFGYHDDSFAWATLDTGKDSDAWFFIPSLKKAGISEKWKRFPIGGEIRPEIWPTTFTDQNHAQEQNFSESVRQSHISWAMDSGVFSERFPFDEKRKARALSEVAKMGYELHVSEARLDGADLVIKIENRGVAPFYYDWPVEVSWSAPAIKPRPLITDWKLTQVLPGQPVEWRIKLAATATEASIRIPSPMPGGSALRFANKEQEGDRLLVWK